MLFLAPLAAVAAKTTVWSVLGKVALAAAPIVVSTVVRELSEKEEEYPDEEYR